MPLSTVKDMRFDRPRRFPALASFARGCRWFGVQVYESLIQVGYFMTLTVVDEETHRSITSRTRNRDDPVRPRPLAPDDRPLTAPERRAWSKLAAHLSEARNRESGEPVD